MRPGECSETGFLGRSEHLLQRLHTDDEWLRQHRIAHEQIADRLETVIGEARRAWGLALRSSNRGRLFFIVHDRYEVEINPSCGFQQCPFSLDGDPRRFKAGPVKWCGEGASNYVIRDRVTRQSLFVPHLAIHLIRDHHCFEGETLHRVEPAAVTALFEIEPSAH